LPRPSRHVLARDWAKGAPWLTPSRMKRKTRPDGSLPAGASRTPMYARSSDGLVPVGSPGSHTGDERQRGRRCRTKACRGYSYFSARSGSADAARRAGNHVAIESRFPEALTQHRDVGTARPTFLTGEGAPEHRNRAQKLEEAAGHLTPVVVLGLSQSRQAHAGLNQAHSRHTRERSAVTSPCFEDRAI
jgi:hypothetical protein